MSTIYSAPLLEAHYWSAQVLVTYFLHCKHTICLHLVSVHQTTSALPTWVVSFISWCYNCSFSRGAPGELRVNAGVVWLAGNLHLSALEVRFSRRCAIQIDVYLTLPHLFHTCLLTGPYVVIKSTSAPPPRCVTSTVNTVVVETVHWSTDVLLAIMDSTDSPTRAIMAVTTIHNLIFCKTSNTDFAEKPRDAP